MYKNPDAKGEMIMANKRRRNRYSAGIPLFLGGAISLGVIIMGIFFFTQLHSMAGEVLSPSEALERIDNRETIILLDVRTRAEYNQIRIPGSTHIPLDELETLLGQQIPDVDSEILIYCRSGNRSATAARILKNMGYHTVYDMGGIIDWPYATESGPVSE